MFDGDGEGVGREGLSEYPYLLMSMNLWPVDWDIQSERMNTKLDEDNGKSAGNGEWVVSKFSAVFKQ